MNSPIRIESVPLPASLDTPDAEPLHAVERIDDAHDLATWGWADTGQTARYLWGALSYPRYYETVLLVGRLGGDLAGYAWLVMPLTGRTTMVEFTLIVHPDRRGRGVGTTLLHEVRRVAAQRERTMLVTWSECTPEPAPDDPDALAPPTEFGRIRRSDPSTRFALTHGFKLDQVERHSVLRLPVPAEHLAQFEADSLAQAGAEYRLHQWPDATPDAWRADIAALVQRMSTDVPHGETDLGESAWDADKIAYEHEAEAAEGKQVLFTAVEHVPSGRLVGYTNLQRFAQRPAAMVQEDTIVAPEHRGHRLGMAIKAANLRLATERWPEARRLHTWNAEENAHMLAINVALGFEPIGTDALWIDVPDGDSAAAAT